MDDATVFRALADSTRRDLLDVLLQRDGQTLRELAQRHAMTRFGVMKHLRVLEGAGLIVVKRRGREKVHYLNPVPIRLIHDRWVSAYAAPWAAALSTLKQTLERNAPMEKVFEIYIKTTPERLWEAITLPDLRATYTFGVQVTSDYTAGSGYAGTARGGAFTVFAGENLVVDPPKKLVQSYRALWDDGVKAAGTSRVTWEITPIAPDSCRLVVTHDELRDDAPAALYGGWPMIVSGIKTLLETGESLTTPGSLAYAGA